MLPIGEPFHCHAAYWRALYSALSLALLHGLLLYCVLQEYPMLCPLSSAPFVPSVLIKEV